MSRFWLLLLTLGSFAAHAATFEECGSLKNHYGPYDYWADKDKLDIVEQYHFTPGVEQLKKRATGDFGADIAYLLGAFPNHPRGLMTMIRLGEKEKTERPAGASYSIPCYLERAVRFRPEDGTARLILANYLAKKGKQAEALQQLETARSLAGDSANIQYNLGLAYFEMKDYDKALDHAQRAYQLGFGLPGLRNKLQKIGKWRDPEPEKPAPAGEEAKPSDGGNKDGVAPEAGSSPNQASKP